MDATKPRSKTRFGRPADRQDLIVQEIRQQIVVGHLSPGSRLPNRDEIEQKYGAGASTVQHAFDRLKRDGFIYSQGRNGTFVSFEPPHLTRYAVVFPGVPSEAETWVRFWTALANEAINLQHKQDRKLPLYYGVAANANAEDYRKLLDDVVAHRVAGIIFATVPHYLVGTPILDEPGIPRIAIMTPTNKFDFPSLSPDVGSFFDKALDFLHRRGCRKIAFLNPTGLKSRFAAVIKNLEAHGMATRPFWDQSVDLRAAHTARNIAHLLMNTTQLDRPDGLIVSDDNLVEYACAGLVAAGVRVPEDIKVVAHCNFPEPTPSVLPVTRLGFDAREVLGTAIDQIDTIRRGKKVPPITKIPAHFEAELLRAV